MLTCCWGRNGTTKANESVEKFQCREGKDQDILWCGEVKGFGMRLSRKTGTRTYILLCRVKGTQRERYITIGRHNDPYRVEQARSKAVLLKDQMKNGIDPVEQERKELEEKRRQEERDEALNTTLREVMEHYLHHKRLRPSTQKDIRSHCNNDLASWLDEPVATITRDKCLAKFTEISKRAPSRANLCMVYLRALLNHARKRHATPEGDYPLLAINPVTQMFDLTARNPEKTRTTRIPLDRIGTCWNWLRSRATEGRTETERTAADWLCFILLTGCRRTEAGSLRWADVDLEGKTFTLREEVTKNHMPLTLPMSTVMHELLSARKSPPLDDKVARRRRRERAAEYVFASNGKKTPYIGNAQAALGGLSKLAGTHVHLHALRRTFDDISMECRIDSDVRRMLLNHKGGDIHARHYSNSTRALIPAVEAVAKWIAGEAEKASAVATGENVVPLQKRQHA